MIQPDKQQLFEEARRYDEAGDTYNAVKLYKRLIKIDPDWLEPHAALGRIYHERREWKPAYHYLKKTVALQSDLREAWWRIGIAATALKKTRVARSVWAKFGITSLPKSPEGLRLQYDNTFEILWMMPLDPARAQLLSIPHPASGFRYKEVVLYERKPIGHHIVDRKRIPVYAELGTFKTSPYQTFSCLLHTSAKEAISRLERLCFNSGIGFEVWSNSARSMVIDNPQAFPEYYGRSFFADQNLDEIPDSSSLIAMAAVHEAEVHRVLNDWQIITFGEFSDLRQY